MRKHFKGNYKTINIKDGYLENWHHFEVLSKEENHDKSVMILIKITNKTNDTQIFRGIKP
jgi:hypothetical protein